MARSSRDHDSATAATFIWPLSPFSLSRSHRSFDRTTTWWASGVPCLGQRSATSEGYAADSTDRCTLLGCPRTWEPLGYSACFYWTIGDYRRITMSSRLTGYLKGNCWAASRQPLKIAIRAQCGFPNASAVSNHRGEVPWGHCSLSIFYQSGFAKASAVSNHRGEVPCWHWSLSIFYQSV